MRTDTDKRFTVRGASHGSGYEVYDTLENDIVETGYGFSSDAHKVCSALNDYLPTRVAQAASDSDVIVARQRARIAELEAAEDRDVLIGSLMRNCLEDVRNALGDAPSGETWLHDLHRRIVTTLDLVDGNIA